jgi:FixJ family two-component response regulator
MPDLPLVAIVDDDGSMREAISNLLAAAGLHTVTFDGAQSFLQAESRHSTACLVVDVRMPGISGMELHNQLMASGDVIPTILISAHLDDSLRARARSAGIACCLDKPFAPEELIECVRTALTHSQSPQSRDG